MNIFEVASRKKLTITTPRGLLSVEQLWDLPLKSGQLNLNNIAVALKHKISKMDDVIDLVDGDSSDLLTSSKLDDDKLRLDVVMYIIKVLKSERDDRQNKEALNSQLRMIDDAIAEQEYAELVKGSAEELKKRRQEIIDASATNL